MTILNRKIFGLMLLSAVTVALGMMVANHLVLRQVRQEALRQAGQQQEASLRTFWELLNAKGREFRVEKGVLWAGAYPINGDHEIPDKVFSLTGSRATVFQGDIRVATNVLLPNGERATGTRLSGPAFESVFRQGLPYRGEAPILGLPYFTAYDPIRNARGEIIGALFVGAKKAESLARYESMSLKIRAINGTLAVVFVLVAILFLCERKRSVGAMEKQLGFQRVLLNTIPSPIFYRDASGRYSGCNQAFLELVGLSREHLIGKTIHEVWPPELAQRYHQMDQELLEHPGLQIYEFQIRHADGTMHDVIFNRAALLRPDGAPDGVIGVMVDISERKAAEEEIKNAYERTTAIVEFLPDGAFVVDREKRVIAWNRAMEEMTGIAKEQMLGSGNLSYSVPFYGDCREILIDLLDESPELIQGKYENGKKEGSTIFGEIKLERYRGGEDRIFRGAAAPLFDREGNRIGGIQTIRDITELRKTAQEQNRLEAQLHHSRMMELLVFQLSHDLKTPLTPLFALLPLALKRVEDPQLQRMLELCLQSAGQIQGLVDKSLDLVRLSSESNRPELVPIGLAAAVQVALEAVAPLLAQRGITPHNGIAAGLRVLGAADQLALLFGNLFTNAARYAAQDGAVRVGAGLKDGSVEISVKDDGAGLDPDHTSLIFCEFFKADPARHDLGTKGLGLAICQRIVSNHGGRIWAQSAGKGQGTTIFFTLQHAGSSQATHLPQTAAKEVP